MRRSTPSMLRSAKTSRTYPVGAEDLARAIAEAVRGLPRWSLEGSSETEVRAVYRARLGFEDDVAVRLTPSSIGAHTNTHASFESVSRLGMWYLGQNSRNLKGLLVAIDRELRS